VAGSIVAPAKQVLRLWRRAFGADEVATACVHAVKNVGGGNAAELATFFVEKGKPLFTVVE
jgi:hypothetical protein